MKRVSILIPSYKRPQVLKLTLEGLVNTLSVRPPDLLVGVYVGLNVATKEITNLIKQFCPLFSGKGVDFRWLEYPDNIGKASCLNNLFIHFCKGSSYVITLDNDMLLKSPWLHLIDIAAKTDFEMMGFASSSFWAHIPGKVSCSFFQVDGYKVYRADGIAGGMLLFPYYFLERHKWTNLGGVYGRDDEQMCLKTKRKYVLEQESDWLQHDILGPSGLELENYQKKKQSFFDRKIYVFQKGWDN